MSGMREDFEDDIALAGEYALGLLPDTARVSFETRLVNEPRLRQMVVDWDELLAPMAEAIPSVTPPKRVQKAVEATVFASGPATQERRGFAPWFGALAGGLAAAAVVAAVILIEPGGPSLPAPTHSAALESTDSDMRLDATINDATGKIEIALISGAPPEGRVLELWLITPDAPTPVSLGVVPTVLDLDEMQRDNLQGAVFAVSDEPPGGSPTGQATGSVLALGPVIALSGN